MKRAWVLMSIFVGGVGCGGCDDGGKVTQTNPSVPPSDALDKEVVYALYWRLEAGWRQEPVDGLRAIVTEKAIFWGEPGCEEVRDVDGVRECAIFEVSVVGHVQVGRGRSYGSNDYNLPMERYDTLPWFERSHVRLAPEGRLSIFPCSPRDPNELGPLMWEQDEETGALYFAKDVTCEDGSVETATWMMRPIECEKTIHEDGSMPTRSECSRWRLVDAQNR